MRYFWHEYGDIIKGIMVLLMLAAIIVLFTWGMIDRKVELVQKKEFCYSQGYYELKDDYCFRLADGNTETLYAGDVSW